MRPTDQRAHRARERVRAEAERRILAWQERDQAGRTVHAPEGRVEAVKEHGAGASRYQHDERGELVGLVEPDGRRTSFRYDDLRRLVRVEHPDGGATSYTYDARDLLVGVDERGVARRFEYDEVGRLRTVLRGNADPLTFRYDEEGRPLEASTPLVSTQHAYDKAGRIASLRQVIDGVALELTLAYDKEGRVTELGLPGAQTVRYTWGERGRIASLALGGRGVARFEYEPAQLHARVLLANGLIEETQVDPVDGRPRARTVRRQEGALFHRDYMYGPAGELLEDGVRRYTYDGSGRLSAAEEREGNAWRFEYDALDNLVRMEEPGGERRFAHAGGRLVGLSGTEGHAEVASDDFGRVVGLSGAEGWTYRYDDAGQLVQVLRHGAPVAGFLYDHKSRLVLARFTDRTERYLYGPDDALVAVTDATGRWRRLPLCSPYGVVAELRADGGLVFLHHDARGACHLATDEAGRVVACFGYTPFGAPSGEGAARPAFGSRGWVPEVGLYGFGTRWYHPRLGRFLTPDTYSAGPDDERLVHPGTPARRQAAARTSMLADWLRRPRLRNRYAFCGNDPVNRVDPDGHWSFGGVLLTLLGLFWTLPNTVIGLLIEISNLVGEVIRWLVWLVTAGHATWHTLGFDAAASSRLNAFALVFKFGWFGELLNAMKTYAITFGDVIFVSPMGEKLLDPSRTRKVRPKAYKGRVELPLKDTLYEHELRHTNQYGWFGPFFLGFYLVDAVFLHDYWHSWTETDARNHSFDESDPLSQYVPTDVALVLQTKATNPQPFKQAWVYRHDAGKFTPLRTDDQGNLLALPSGKDADRPELYTDPYKAQEQSLLELFASFCAKRLPDTALHALLPMFQQQVVPWADPVEKPDGARVALELDEILLSLTKPAPLSLWPLLWEPLPKGYATSGLSQGASLWKLQKSKYKLQVSEDDPATPPDESVRPQERALVVEGRVDARAAWVRVVLFDAQGSALSLKLSRDAFTSAPWVSATLGAPAGNTRPFQAALYLFDPAQALGPVFIEVYAGPVPSLVELFFCQLVGVQIALVDDHTAADISGQAPGKLLDESDEVIVVDFKDSPSASGDAQRAQAQARRMVPYDHHFRQRELPLSNGRPVVPLPEMPLWMMELQLVGVARSDLQQLLALRKALLPGKPATLDFEIAWEFKLEWGGPDRSATGSKHFREDHTLPVGIQRATVKLLEDGTVEDTKLAEPVAYPVAGRRPPRLVVQGRTRRWGRRGTGPERDAVVIEYQPQVAADAERMRGGNGHLVARSLSIAGVSIEPGLIIVSGNPVPPPADTPVQELPPFRVRGTNPPDLGPLVDALISERVHDHQSEAYIQLLPLDMWQATMRLIAGHESSRHQFDPDPSRVTLYQSSAYGLEKNMPLFGPPHGYGYGQLDSPPDSVKQDANWSVVENLRRSIDILMDGARDAYGRISQHMAGLLHQRIQAVYQREIVRSYNGGREFRWNGSDWEINPSLRQWEDESDHTKGPYQNLLYPNQVLGTHVVYFQGKAENTTFPWPIAFTEASYGPGI